jgi:predicted ATP-dependent protease
MDPQSPPTPKDPSMSPPPPPKVKKNPAKKKEKPPPPKLAYEMTEEELNEHVRKEVREQFAPRKPEPKQPVDPAGQKFFVTMCQPREKETLSDYDHSITKSYQKKSNRRGKNIPKLREQSQQSIPPLQVLSKEDEATAEFVVETKLTKAQLLGEVPIPNHLGAGRKPFVMGNLLCGLSC